MSLERAKEKEEELRSPLVAIFFFFSRSPKVIATRVSRYQGEEPLLLGFISVN